MTVRPDLQLLPFHHYVFEWCELVDRAGGETELVTIPLLVDSLMILEATIKYPGQGVEVDLFEVVRRQPDGRAGIEKYRYRCWHSGRLVFRYELDPRNHPEMPEHKHIDGDVCMRTEGVTVPEVLGSMWDDIAREQRRFERALVRA